MSDVSEATEVARSKRLSLRFSIKGQTVSYKTAYDDGEALLVNISTGGCVVQKASVPVEVAEKILFSFDNRNLDQPLEMRASCVRQEGDSFAAKFLGVDDAEEKRLVKIFALMARAES